MQRPNRGFNILRKLFQSVRSIVTHKQAQAATSKAQAEALPAISTMMTAKPPQVWVPPSDSGQPLFVVWDALGDGRLVGVFNDEELVKSIVRINPYYYRYYQCTPGHPTALALHWLDDDGRSRLIKSCTDAITKSG